MTISPALEGADGPHTDGPSHYTAKEYQVASILLEVSSIVLDTAPRVPLEFLRWGIRRRRTDPPYQFKTEPEPEPDPADRSDSTDEEDKKNKKKPREETETTASPVTPLCFPHSGSSEEQIVIATPPPVKQPKKPYSQKERLKEKKEQVLALTKEKADLSKELQELQERLRKLNAMKIYLKDQNSKLSTQAEWRALNPPNWGSPFVGALQYAPTRPPVTQSQIERPRLELDLNEEPVDDAAEYGVAMQVMYRDDDRAAKSAEARKRRLEIQRERRSSPSSAQKRSRVW